MEISLHRFFGPYELLNVTLLGPDANSKFQYLNILCYLIAIIIIIIIMIILILSFSVPFFN
jgi:hypothetical protein